MAIYIIIDENNLAINVIDWDGNPGWGPPEGTTAIQYDGPFWPNAVWDGTALIDPNPPVVNVYTGVDANSVGPTSIS